MKKMEQETDKKQKKRKQKKMWTIILGVLLLLIAGTLITVFALRWSGKRSMTHHEATDVEITVPEEAKVMQDGTMVTYKGKTYQRNEDIVTILCMGIDKSELEEKDAVIGSGGQADTVFVVALDTATGMMKMLNISRDTMIDVDLYNVNNEYVKTEKKQLCLAYAYGDGKESSCENVKKSVSRLLYGMPIDAYAAIDIPAIVVLNDAIGGVEVEVLEDMTDADPELYVGNRVLLQGKQTELYVRSRHSEEGAPIDSNNDRMARQKQYMIGFIQKALAATKEDLTIPLTLYQTAKEYMVTDIGVSEVTYLASLVLQGGFQADQMINLPGEVTLVDGHAQYHMDEIVLYETILDVFYNELTK